MTSMKTWRVGGYCGSYGITITLCGTSVVVEDHRDGASVVIRGGSVVAGERIYQRDHATEDEAYGDAMAQIAAARLMPEWAR